MIMYVIILALVLLSPIIWWHLKLRKFKSLDHIPGPKPKMFIGNADILGTNSVDLLKSFVKLHKDYGPVLKLWIGSRFHLLIIKPEYVEFFLNSNTHLAKSSGYDLLKPWLGDGLLVSEGDKWRTRRKMITHTFHFKILELFLEVFNKNVDILIHNLSAAVKKGNDVEISNFVNLCSLDIICETAFGISIEAQTTNKNIEYVRTLRSFLELFIARFFSVWKRNPFLFKFSAEYKTYQKYLGTLHAFTENVIKTRKEAYEKNRSQRTSLKQNDEGIKRKSALLDMLLEASDSGAGLTDEDIREEVDTFMFEGHDTTSSAISFSLYALAVNTEVQEKVYKELVDALGPNSDEFVSYKDIQGLKYLDLATKECLRMYPTVPLIERRLHTDCVLDGFTIPKGTDVTMVLYCMCHNEEVFPNPDKFDPERFRSENQGERNNFAYVPFSAGSRNCIGQKFALLELKLALAKIVRQFKLSEVPGFVPEIGMAGVLKSRNLLTIRLAPRNQK